MPYQISLDFPGTPKGQELSIPGLGTYKNGSTSEVTEDEANLFRAYQASNNMPDTTLIQSFQKDPYVSVSRVHEEKEEAPKNKGAKADEEKEGDK